MYRARAGHGSLCVLLLLSFGSVGMQATLDACRHFACGGGFCSPCGEVVGRVCRRQQLSSTKYVAFADGNRWARMPAGSRLQSALAPRPFRAVGLEVRVVNAVVGEAGIYAGLAAEGWQSAGLRHGGVNVVGVETR